MTMKYAIFPHQDAWAVAHLGYCRIPMTDKFQTCWVLDQICSSPEQAEEAMSKLDRANKARVATELADQMAAMARRR